MNSPAQGFDLPPAGDRTLPLRIQDLYSSLIQAVSLAAAIWIGVVGGNWGLSGVLVLVWIAVVLGHRIGGRRLGQVAQGLLAGTVFLVPVARSVADGPVPFATSLFFVLFLLVEPLAFVIAAAAGLTSLAWLTHVGQLPLARIGWAAATVAATFVAVGTMKSVVAQVAQTAERRRALLKRALQAAESRQLMTAGIGHDLGNSLASLVLSLEVLTGQLAGRGMEDEARDLSGVRQGAVDLRARIIAMLQDVRSHPVPADPDEGSLSVDQLRSLVERWRRMELPALAKFFLVAFTVGAVRFIAMGLYGSGLQNIAVAALLIPLLTWVSRDHSRVPAGVQAVVLMIPASVTSWMGLQVSGSPSAAGTLGFLIVMAGVFLAPPYFVPLAGAHLLAFFVLKPLPLTVEYILANVALVGLGLGISWFRAGILTDGSRASGATELLEADVNDWETRFRSSWLPEVGTIARALDALRLELEVIHSRHGLKLVGIEPKLLSQARVSVVGANAVAGGVVDSLSEYQGSWVPGPRAQALTDALTWVQSVLSARPEHRNIPMDFSMQPGLVLAWPPFALSQAMLNLVDNASRYCRVDCVGEPWVKLEARAHDASTAEIIVRDSGRGLSGESLETLTTLFTQGASGDRAKGFGVGLAVVAGYAHRCGGALEVISEPGEESAFRLTVPLASVTDLLG